MKAITAPSLTRFVPNTISSCSAKATKNRMNIFLASPLIPASLLTLPFFVLLLFLNTIAKIKPDRKSIIMKIMSAINNLSNPPNRYEAKEPMDPTIVNIKYLTFKFSNLL